MSKMTLSSKEQKIFSNTIWPIVSGPPIFFFEKVGDKVGMILQTLLIQISFGQIKIQNRSFLSTKI